MNTPLPVVIAQSPFSDDELQSLKAFYAGERVRSIRKRLPNPWPLIARHRALAHSEFAIVMDAPAALVCEL
ncbi:hypothetical protein [Congregibacter litoralis]|uniref:Uncharacterized protein n=1 Tax=Congregibacter litoralis KT71 TaxID=314285 RepID=V7HUY1_9GAMM|nr:hypothetical protein [Congregibacter litoralis]ESZ89379.1 hypothetical protein KT71_003455 [Congregibacter litoralis KT71]